MTASATWKVGPLAEASGLTVRTLHHWDTIGLLHPSQRTSGGHREYTEQDVVRLYQVMALRSLGLGLDTIAVCLDTGIDSPRLVRDHLATVEASIAGLDLLRQRLRRLDAELSGERTPSTSTFFEALRATGRSNPEGERVLRSHLDADQLHVLEARSGSLGPTRHYLLEVEWPELYRRAEILRTEGVAPTDQRVQRIAARLDELSSLFSGGDADISAGVRAAWHDDPAAMSGDPGAPADEWRELADYLDRARGSA